MEVKWGGGDWEGAVRAPVLNGAAAREVDLGEAWTLQPRLDKRCAERQHQSEQSGGAVADGGGSLVRELLAMSGDEDLGRRQESGGERWW